MNKLAKISSNPGIVKFYGLLQFLRYIRDKKNLGLKYYFKIEDAPLSDLFRKAGIKYDNQLIVFSYFSFQNCPDTGRSKGSYISFYLGGPIDHCTHVPGPVSYYISESDYISA